MPADPPVDPPRLTRRRLLQLGLALPLPMVLAACDDAATDQPGAAAPATTAPPASATTAAGAAGTLAPRSPATTATRDASQTEGPYFTPNSPERASLLEAGMGGRLLVRRDRPHHRLPPGPAALLDFWQADAAGAYDNQGYRMRGHQFSDAAGALVAGNRRARPLPGPDPPHPRQGPGPQRPRPDDPALLPRRAGQRRDGIFSPELVLGDVRESGNARQGSFTFVLEG